MVFKKLNIKYHKSQLFHLDKKGKYVKVFICLSKINSSNGPFTFIDALQTKKFSKIRKIYLNQIIQHTLQYDLMIQQ